MASEWGMGMEFGFGGATAAAAAGYPNSYLYGLPSSDTLRIDDLLDFSNHDGFSGPSAAAGNIHSVVGYNQSAPEVTGIHPLAGESGSHVSSFADDIYIPTEEAAELEWLSKFVEESFSDVHYQPSAAAYFPASGQIRVDAAAAVPGRGARSKRSRAAPAKFSANLMPNQSSSSSSTSSSSSSEFPSAAPGRKQVGGELGGEGGARRCTHCASEKTPQWRTGPLGPKTLCNACGVRYKSGRLVPEYRPAASPTFVLTQHSNSHRKVMELRRQKEQLHLLRHEDLAAAGGRQPEIIYIN